ncbi:MAG: AAA-associated domain-containing protein [Thaumarchaeota archaeon]|nr:AAA-associated domain-containing protein [Nitrososphaerota archaeon]
MAEPRRPLPVALQMPASVRAGQVISLVEVAGGIGGKVDAPKLADELGADLAVLLSILDAAEMLGLVRTEKGDVYLTELGHRFQKTLTNKVTILKERLANIEPFRTALELAAKGKAVMAEQVADSLAEIGIKWHYRAEINETLVKTLMIHWAIYAGLLKYDGKSGKFWKA